MVRRAGLSGVAGAGALAGTLAFAQSAQAVTITVNVTGASTSRRCNLTDAIQAAQTDTAVKGCSAGKSTETDTIQLAANTTYQDYGKALYIPSSTGALVIQGAADNTEITTRIFAKNYGYPTGAGISTTACDAPAAVFVGGNVTLKKVFLEAAESGLTGICQYAGSLTTDLTRIEEFNRGAMRSWPNSGNAHRNLTVKNALIQYNTSIHFGGAIAAFGDVTLNVTNPLFQFNLGEELAGAVYVGPVDGSNTLGNVTFSGGSILYNETYSMGGGVFLNGTGTSASVTIDGLWMSQNDSIFQGGALCVSGTWGTNKVKISNSIFQDNSSSSVPQQGNLNADAYDAVSCRSNSHIVLSGSDWTHTPPLKGDGTCTF
ncbi:MAG: hypothetical protein QM756_16305 [Polyangiaceae bacterium]